MSLFNSNDGFKIKKLETSLAEIATNLRSAGADNTGVTKCTSLFISLTSGGKKLYIPNGTFSIDDVNVIGDLYLIGNGKNSILKCGKIYATGNVYIDGVHFISSSVNNNPVGNGWSYALQLDGDGTSYHDGVVKNSIIEFTTDSSNVLNIHAQYFNTFLLENNKIYTGGVEIDYTNSVRAINNYFDMRWANANEVFHFNRYVKDILVDVNTVYHTSQDFVDLYANGCHATISNNYIEGIQNQYAVEVKTLLRDAGADFGSSNSIGSINNVTFENNRFIDIRYPYVVNLNTIDTRTTPVNNDTQYYSRDIRFINNYFDFTTGETSAGNPYLTQSCVVFFTSGCFSPFLEKNIVKCTAFKSTYLMVFQENNQKTLYPVVRNNEMIPNEFGSTVPINYLVSCHTNAQVVGGILDGNILYGKYPCFLQSDSPSIEFFMNNNQSPNYDDTQAGGFYYSIDISATAQNIVLDIQNMKIYQVQLKNVTSKVKFTNCNLIGRVILQSTGVGNEYIFKNCDLGTSSTGTSYINFSGGTIALISLLSNVFRGSSNLLKGTATAITKYYSNDNQTPNVAGTSVWDASSTLIPTKTDNSSKF
jgi:hypothetical protein